MQTFLRGLGLTILRTQVCALTHLSLLLNARLILDQDADFAAFLNHAVRYLHESCIDSFVECIKERFDAMTPYFSECSVVNLMLFRGFFVVRFRFADCRFLSFLFLSYSH